MIDDSDRDSSGRFVEGNHAREERLLTPEELEKIEKLVAGGARDSGVAKGLRVSYRLFKYLKAERQQEAITEAITTGEAVLHDALMHRMVRIALQTDDLREARTACESLLAMRFNYRTRGDAVSVGINMSDATAPALTIIAEQIDPVAFERVLSANQTQDGEPHERLRVPVAPRRSLVQQETDPFAHERYNLADKW